MATTATGIVLFTVASGVQATNASITYALYPTVQAVANAINALNLGWTATPVQGYALYPSADFKIIQGAMWRFDKEKSVIYGSLPPSQDGNPNIRVDYVGGFNPIPDDVQRACLLVAVSLWGAGRINPFLKSESALDYSYTNNNESKAIPPAAREILAGYVDSAARYCNWS